MNKLTYKIIIRDDIPRKDGKCLLFLQAFVNKARVRIPLSIYLSPNNWDSKQEKVIPGKHQLLTKSEITDLNMIIGKIKGRVNDIFINSRLLNRTLGKEEFTKEFANPSIKYDFIHFCEREIKDLSGIRTVSTVKTYTITLTILRRFTQEIRFSDLNFEFIDGFNKFMVRSGIGINTRWKYHKIIKTFIHLAIKKGIPIENPYLNFRTEKAQTERTFLTQNEVNKLIEVYNNPLLPEHLKNVLSYFLWSCFTGLRISDIHQITNEMIVEDTLVFVPVKTRNKMKVLKIPLTSMAKSFISHDSGNLFRPVYRTNQLLKEIAYIAEIDKNLTFHIARHTFATVFLELGGSVEVLKDLLGHSKLETTMVYVHINQDRKKQQMKGFDTAFKK